MVRCRREPALIRVTRFWLDADKTAHCPTGRVSSAPKRQAVATCGACVVSEFLHARLAAHVRPATRTRFSLLGELGGWALLLHLQNAPRCVSQTLRQPRSLCVSASCWSRATDAAMSWLFGARKTPADLLRENKRMLDKAIRELDRERTGLQAQEKKLIAEIKRVAKQNQMAAVRLMAKDLIRTRNSVTKFYALKSQLKGVSLRMQTLKSTQAMADAMRCARLRCTPCAQRGCPALTRLATQRRDARDGWHEPPAQLAGVANHPARF